MPKTSEGYEVPFELNKFINEEVEVEVMRPEIDPDNPQKKKFVSKKEKFTQKTIYIDAPLRPFMCKWPEHLFMPWQPNRFKCEKCGFIQIASPIQVRYNPETKKLVPRSFKT